MLMCEDFPCCGHEMGCCPSYDDDGRQSDMRCICGVSLPLDNHVSVCANCLDDELDGDHAHSHRFDDFEDPSGHYQY